MRFLKSSSLLILTALTACSQLPKKEVASTPRPVRHVAGLNALNTALADQESLQNKVDVLLEGVFHSYLMGQVYLQKFDAELDKNPEQAMKSDSYSTLLSVRSYVDSFEHDINDLYMGLVMASALPEYSLEQKLNAEFALNRIGQFMDGVRTDNKKLPENLKPLILSNLREKQTALYDDLKALHDDESFHQNDESVKSVLHKNMTLLRATRMAYFKDMNKYQVDPSALEATLKEESGKVSFQNLEKNIKSLSKDMKQYISEIGRGTSSDSILPSAGPSGNITGRGFPAGTWALTYDDGPGAKTSPTVLQNLLDRKIPATFFMLAKQVVALPQTAMKIKDAGMDIASHSYTHAQLTKVGPAQLEKEIGTAKKVTEDKLGVQIKLFRLPYGAGVSVSRIRAKIAAHKMIHVFWSVDTLDWQDKNPQSVYNRALKQMAGQKSGVILFHDIHPQSVIASTMLMDYFNEHKEKLTVCSVQGIVDQINKNLPSCK